MSDQGPVWVQSEDKIPGGFKSTPKIIFSLPSSSLVTQLSEKVWHANGGDICDDDNYLGQLVTEARVQGGETALWSKWDTSTTTLKYHHLRHLWRYQWKHYGDTLQNYGFLGSFLLICKVPLYYENQIGFSIWQHPSFRYCAGMKKKLLQATNFAEYLRNPLMRYSANSLVFRRVKSFFKTKTNHVLFAVEGLTSVFGTEPILNSLLQKKMLKNRNSLFRPILYSFNHNDQQG